MDKNFLRQLPISFERVSASSGKGWMHNEEHTMPSFSPINNELIGETGIANDLQYEIIVQKATLAFETWKLIPAPKRGEIIRQVGEAFRKHKEPLGRLVSYEMGKSLQEGMGEVQEIIDICDYAVGLSRQLYGLSMQSERPGHRMLEQYHPLGVVGIISAFNFPVAVWAWNSVIAWVCGDVCVWKPSEKVPFCAIACQNIVSEVFTENGLPEGISSVVMGGKEVGEKLSHDVRIPLLSATGSVRMGREVGEAVAKRMGRALLELGGNNAIIVTASADLSIAIPAIVFGAVGTAGQRCTTTRRVIIHDSIFEMLAEKLSIAYGQLKIGDPLEETNHVGPLIDQQAVRSYLHAIEQVQESGGKAWVEGGLLQKEGMGESCYVKPCIYEVKPYYDIVQEETFAPILYLIRYQELTEAISYQNGVRQGLSSAIMTTDMREAETFLSAVGSDCGIANVNIGTSGAEIGGAFGGEKETGGGREAGSDAWKVYMRRQTVTINYSSQLPLAQGIRFDLWEKK